MANEPGAVSNRTGLLVLALLTIAAGGATRVMAALPSGTLLPWAGLVALAIGATFRRPRTLDLFAPFTFLSWTHFAPSYVVSASLLALGVLEYSYSYLVLDPVGALSLTLFYVVLGYLALGLGCRSQAAAVLGRKVARILPPAAETRTTPLPVILLLVAIGLGASYAAFSVGIIGYALPRPPRAFDAAAAYAVSFLSLGHFLFWFRWFDRRQRRLPTLSLALPLLIVVASMVIWGNRGTLLTCYLLAAFAFRYARGRLSLAQGVAMVALALVALGVGMVYGTMFRALKGGETGTSAATASGVDAAAPVEGGIPVPPTAGQSLQRQIATSAAVAQTLVGGSGMVQVPAILVGIGRRLDILSDASVTIARYRELGPGEASSGVASLWTMTWSAFVPRAVWPGKPRTGDVRAYAALYFGTGINSFAITPVADLIRNVGPFGMPLGMALLGLLLGTLQIALVAGDGPAPPMRAAVYAILLSGLNLEGPYGTVLPTMMRVGFVLLLGLGILWLWQRRDVARESWRPTPA